MADFLDALGQYATNRFNTAIEPFNDPQQAINNRLGINTATNAAPVAAPVNPQMGPTIAASQGLQPNNPLNMAKPVGPTAPANTAQTNAILPSNQISPATVAAPTAPAANQQPDQLNAPHLTSGNGPTQIPTGQGAIPPAVQNPVQAPQPAPGARVTNAVQPGANYYQGIANQESGGNPNIGYHNNGSTAYGTYGITAPAYQDVQRADPYFASKSITALTPEDQQRAAQVYTTLNGRQLQKNGIDPTDENLRLAHFLGATGAKNYLNNGTISPAAARANGGEDKVRQIIGNIQQGTAQNVSVPGAQPQANAMPGAQPQANAAPVEQPKPFDNEYRLINEGDPVNLLTLAKSDNPAIASAAKAKLYDTFKDQKMQSDAKQIVDAKLANGQNPWPQGKPTDEGSYIKAYLFQRLGLTDLAQQEQEKISPTRSTMAVMLGNDHYAATYNKNGDLLYAYDESGQKVDNATLSKIAANSYNAKTAAQHAQVYADPTGVVKGTYVLETRPNAAPVYKEVGTGRLATPAEAAAMKAQGVQGNLEYQGMQQAQKNQGKLDLLNKELATRLDYIPAQQHNAFISKFNAENGTNFGLMAGPSGKPQLYDKGTTPAGAAPAAAPGQVARPPVAQPGAVMPGAQPNVPTANIANVPGAPTNPSEYKQQQTVSTKEQEAFIKPKSDINANSRVGRETADITRTQVNDLLNSPEMIGYLTADAGTANGQFGKFMREVVAGAYDADATGKTLADKMRELSVPTALQSKIQAYQQQNVRINALTLKSNEGPGSISNFENKQNQAANMSNIGDLTPYSVLTGLGKRQFIGDMTMAKQQFLNAHPELKTETQFENAWAKESDKAMKAYQGIYQARLDAIKPYYDSAMKNTNDNKVQQSYRDAAIAAFKTYPTPDWNAQTGKWEYKTKQAKMAAMNALVGGQ